MNEFDKIINSLSEDELDTLNSDPQLLSDFKARLTPKQPEKENPILKGINDFGAGATEGATFGTTTIDKAGNLASTQEPESIPGSIMQNNGSAAPDIISKYSGVKGAGRAMGSLIPLVISELYGGASAGQLALKYGMSAVQEAMNAAGLTMATYEWLKGSIQGKPVLDIAKDAATGYAAGAPLGAASYGAGKAFDYITKDVPTKIGNQYLRPSGRVADSLTDKGKPDLGETFLKDTNYDSSMSKKDVYRDINRKLETNREIIGDKYRNADAAIPTGTTETVKEYVPLDIRRASKVPGPGSNLLNSNLSVQEPTKVTKGFSEVPLPSGYEPSTKKTYEVYNTVPKTDTVDGGYFAEKTIHKGGAYERGALGEPIKVSNLPTGQGGGIDLDEVRSAAAPIKSEQADIGAKGAANSVEDLTGEYGIAPGERVVSNERAFQLLGRLDADVNKAYQALDPNTITPATEARAKMANTLREMLRQAVPDAAELLGENHRLQLYESSLLPQVSGRAPINRGGDITKSISAHVVGNRASLGLARRLEALGTAGTLSNKIAENVISPTAGKLSQQGLAEYLDKVGEAHRGNRK